MVMTVKLLQLSPNTVIEGEAISSIVGAIVNGSGVPVGVVIRAWVQDSWLMAEIENSSSKKINGYTNNRVIYDEVDQ